MPTYFPNGRVLAGASYGGQDTLSIDNAPVPALGLVSYPRALDNTRVAFCQGDGAKIWDTTQPLGPGNPVTVGPPGNWLAGGNGLWAVRHQANPPVYADVWAPATPSDWFPANTGPGAILRTAYQGGGGLHWWDGIAQVPLLPDAVPLFNAEARAVPGTRGWVARINNNVLAHGSGASLEAAHIAVPRSTDIAVADARYVVIWSHEDDALAVIDLVELRIATLLGRGVAAFNACALMADEHMMVHWSTTQGERPGTMDGHAYEVANLDWRSFAAEPEPLPVPHDVMPIRPWPLTMWNTPYQSFNTNQWGNTDDFVGNAILGADSVAHAIQLGAKGLPMIVQPFRYAPQIASLVVGYCLHTTSMADAESQVAALKVRIQAGELPEKPVFLYVDGALVWMDLVERPSWMESRWIWPSPQCYRGSGEALSDFDTRIRQTLTRLRGWGYMMYPTLHAYDRNGQGTEREAIEALLKAREWADEYDFIGIAPFTDMRRGTLPGGKVVGGMEVYPSLRRIVRSMQFANPRDRPSRDDGWVSKDGRKAQILRKLSQSTRHPYLDSADKALLKKALEEM